MIKTLLVAAVVTAGFMFAGTQQAEATWGRSYRAPVVRYGYRNYRPRRVYRRSYYSPRGYYGARNYGYRGFGYGGYGYGGYGRGIGFNIRF